MRRNLNEQLKRMKVLTYGKEILSEQETPQTKIDDPKKADLVSNDVDKFFENLSKINTNVSQQARGSMTYQLEVETIQIGLILLGYELPRFGVDGLYGPETARAVSKFKLDNNISGSTENTKVNESVLSTFKTYLNEFEKVRLIDTSYPNVKFDNDKTKYDEVSKALLDDLQKAAESVGVVATITTAKSGHSFLTTSGRPSRHMKDIAVDISILNGEKANGATNKFNGNPEFREAGDKLKDALEKLGYTWNTELGQDKAVLWQTNTGGNHYNHLHVSNKSGASDSELNKTSSGADSSGSVFTPEMAKVMYDKLKLKGVTAEDLKKYIDPIRSVGSNIDVSGDWIEITKRMLRKSEGFISNAKWDENAFRGGYGTDKKLVNGRLENATQSTTWTKEEAELTLDYQLKNQFAPIIARQLGLSNWNKLTEPQKAALVSLGYNVGPYFINSKEYGRNIKEAITNGDMEKAAQYIENGPVTGSSSGKVYSSLQRRRKEEAQIFMA